MNLSVHVKLDIKVTKMLDKLHLWFACTSGQLVFFFNYCIKLWNKLLCTNKKWYYICSYVSLTFGNLSSMFGLKNDFKKCSLQLYNNATRSSKWQAYSPKPREFIIHWKVLWYSNVRVILCLHPLNSQEDLKVYDTFIPDKLNYSSPLALLIFSLVYVVVASFSLCSKS